MSLLVCHTYTILSVISTLANLQILWNFRCMQEAQLVDISWLPMVAVMIFVFGVNIGVGPIPFVLNGEMFAEEAKGLSGTPVKKKAQVGIILHGHFPQHQLPEVPQHEPILSSP